MRQEKPRSRGPGMNVFSNHTNDHNRRSAAADTDHHLADLDLFSHPDYTVGSGITPDQPPKRVADSTAGRDLHPAPKNLFNFMY